MKDVVANFATRGSENAFTQIAHIQSGFYTSGTAGGTANALTLELPTTFFLNGSADWVLKTPIVVYPTQNNTHSATLQLTIGGRVLGTFKLYKGNKAELVANDILKDVALVCLLDNTKTFFSVANPGAIYAGLGTAATHDVTTSHSDTTAGRVLQVGDGGLLNAGDSRMTLYSQFLAYSSPDFSEVPANGAGWQSAYGLSRRAQAFMNTSGRFYSRFSLSDTAADVTTPWAIHYTTLNKPTAADTGAVAKTGDTMTGKLTVNIDGEAIRIKPKTAGYASYIMSVDSANTNHWYVGAGSTDNADVVFNNYKAGNNSVILKEDGTVSITATHGKTVKVNNILQIGVPGSASLYIGDNDSGLRNSVDGQVDLYSNSHLVGHWNGTELAFTGQMIPTNYANFDARYVQNVRVGAVGTFTINHGAWAEAPVGAFMTGWYFEGDNPGGDSVHYRPIQINVNGSWRTITA